MPNPTISFEQTGTAAALSPELQAETRMYLQKIRVLTKWLAGNPAERIGLFQTWFGGSNVQRSIRMLRNMNQYLQSKCSRIVFVAWQAGAYGAVAPTVLSGQSPLKPLWNGRRLDRPSLFGNLMYEDLIENETDEDYRREGGYLRVPSGMRIYLGTGYVTPGVEQVPRGLATTVGLRVNTIFHEMSHKILKTKDHANPFGNGKCYGYWKCTTIAKTRQELAVTNADNWGHFMADCYTSEGYAS
jgi:hypothetical protein